MAEVLDQLPMWARQGRREKYPYDEWFDGQVWLLTRGVDFVQERGGMTHRIRRSAAKRNLKVTVAHCQMPTGAEVIVVKARGACSGPDKSS